MAPSNTKTDDQPLLVGDDGKLVVGKRPRYLKSTPWYASQNKAPDGPAPAPVFTSTSASQYDAKKDLWAEYDAAEYKDVIDSFGKRRAKRPKGHAAIKPEEPIVDPYSRIAATHSQRDIKDTAYYLTDLGQPIEFEDENVTAPRAPPVPTGADPKLSIPPPTRELEPSAEIMEHDAPHHTARLPMDPLVNGHTEIWGSYYHEGRWGYKCCRQLDYNSPCRHK